LIDITEVNTLDGKLYVAIVEDLGNRKVVAHAMGTRMTSMLPLSSLRKALMERDIPKALICHSDQGSQYRSKPEITRFAPTWHIFVFLGEAFLYLVNIRNNFAKILNPLVFYI